MIRDEKFDPDQYRFVGIGTALGAGIGIALGTSVENIEMGIAIGTGVGLAIGFVIARKERHNEA